jgi:hypothetical protein
MNVADDLPSTRYEVYIYIYIYIYSKQAGLIIQILGIDICMQTTAISYSKSRKKLWVIKALSIFKLFYIYMYLYSFCLITKFIYTYLLLITFRD